MGLSVTLACPAVYSFLLDSHHTLTINGIECAGLAHGLTDNDVIAHPYFGTSAVLRDLSHTSGFSEGLVVINSLVVVRDPLTSLITKMIPVQ